MEKLSDLPPVETSEATPQESVVMKKYFGVTPDGPKTKLGWTGAVKLSFYATALFVILANPWIDSLLCVVPYCGDNALIMLAAKALLFMILLIVVNKFIANN